MESDRGEESGYASSLAVLFPSVHFWPPLEASSCARWRQMEPLDLACVGIQMMHHLGPLLPDSHSQAGRHKYRGAALLDTPSWIHHQIAPDVLLQDSMIFRSVTAVLVFLIYFIVSYFNFRLSYLFSS